MQQAGQHPLYSVRDKAPLSADTMRQAMDASTIAPGADGSQSMQGYNNSILEHVGERSMGAHVDDTAIGRALDKNMASSHRKKKGPHGAGASGNFKSGGAKKKPHPHPEEAQGQSLGGSGISIDESAVGASASAPVDRELPGQPVRQAVVKDQTSTALIDAIDPGRAGGMNPNSR